MAISKKRKIALFLLAIFAGLLLAIVPRVYRVSTEVLHEKWSERGSAYDVQSEYMQSLLLANLRSDLIKDGYDLNGWLLRTLAHWHKNVYESAISKIPQDDTEQVFFWRLYEFVPAVSAHNFQQIKSEVYNKINFLGQHHSQTVFVEKVNKYSMLGDFIEFHIRYDGDVASNWLVLDTAIKILADVDLNFLRSHPNDVNAILKYILSTQALITHLVAKSDKSKDCPVSLVEAWKATEQINTKITRMQRTSVTSTDEQKNIEQISANNFEGPKIFLSYFPTCNIFFRE